MAEVIPIYRGEDRAINITITDALGAVVPISTLQGILVYIDVKGTVIAKYSLNLKVGFGDVIIVDDPGGEVKVLLEASATKNSPIGQGGVEVKITQLDAEFEEGDFEFTTRIENGFIILDSESRYTKP